MPHSFGSVHENLPALRPSASGGTRGWPCFLLRKDAIFTIRAGTQNAQIYGRLISPILLDRLRPCAFTSMDKENLLVHGRILGCRPRNEPSYQRDLYSVVHNKA